MIDDYKDILKVGMIIKNHKILCKLLQEEIKSGNSRDAQLKEWQRHFSYIKQGQKYIITEVYNPPLERIDGRHNGNNTTHSLSKTKIYGVWNGIISRCNYPSDAAYEHYGGRGISMCTEWRSSFVNFYNWAIATGYKECVGLSIDRIDVDGNYEPSNCRWVDNKIQMINRRSSRGRIINVKNLKQTTRKHKRKKDYIVQNVDGMYLAYLIVQNKTYPVGTFFSKEETLEHIDKLYDKLINF